MTGEHRTCMLDRIGTDEVAVKRQRVDQRSVTVDTEWPNSNRSVWTEQGKRISYPTVVQNAVAGERSIDSHGLAESSTAPITICQAVVERYCVSLVWLSIMVMPSKRLCGCLILWAIGERLCRLLALWFAYAISLWSARRNYSEWFFLVPMDMKKE